MNFSQRLARKGGSVPISTLLQPIFNHSIQKYPVETDKFEDRNNEIEKKKDNDSDFEVHEVEHFLLTRTVFDLSKKYKGKDLYGEVKKNYSLEYGEFPYSKENFQRRLKFLQERKALLSKKRKNKELNVLLESNFFNIRKRENKENTIKSDNINYINLVGDLTQIKKELRVTKMKSRKLEKSNLELQTEVELINEMEQERKNKIKKLEEVLSVREITNIDQSRIMGELAEENEKMHSEVEKLSIYKNTASNFKKKIKRKDKQIKELKMQFKQKTQAEIDLDHSITEIHNVSQQVNKIKQNNRKLYYRKNKLEKENVTLSKTVSYYEAQQPPLSLENEHNLSMLDEENEKLKLQIKELSNELSHLENRISVLENPVIETFSDGKYSNELREVVMSLFSCGVSQSKVENVIGTVLRVFEKKRLSNFPSAGWLSNLRAEAKFLGQRQIAELMLSDENVTLHSDGTSKFHRHFQNFQATSSSGQTLSTGLFEVAAGDSETLMNTYLNNISDICSTISNESSVRNKILCSVKNTMSDQGPTNMPFNAKLQKLREDTLPNVVENWDSIEESDKENLLSMGNFFCKLHLLVNFAEEVNKGLRDYELLVMDQLKPACAFDSDSGAAVIALIRATSKALLTGHGSEKSGAGGYFKSFMSGRNAKIELADTAHSRINVIFVNAGSIFHHRKEIYEFLESFPNKNRLLSAVFCDIQEPLFQAELKALGIINKIITGPFWRLCESVDHILDLNQHIYQLQLCLQNWCRDSSLLLTGNELVFPEFTQKDDVWNSLFAEDSDDQIDSICLQVLEMAMRNSAVVRHFEL